MKKILTFSALVILFVSCGSAEPETKEMTVCDCNTEFKALDAELLEKGGSPDLAKKMKEIAGKCDKFQDEMGSEAFMKAMEECN